MICARIRGGNPVINHSVEDGLFAEQIRGAGFEGHDFETYHVSWFPGGGYVVGKLFREHFAETYLASTSGTFRDIGNRASFFAEISQMKPEGWQPGTVDAIATAAADGRRIVVKAVNYSSGANTLLVRLQGSRVPAAATVTVYTITAGPRDTASLDQPDRLEPVERKREYSRDLTIDLGPYTVVVIEISATL
jgi:alpha-N-arabinofuranosidase